MPFTQIMQMQQRFAERAMQEDKFVQQTPGRLSEQGRTTRDETSPLVRMAVDKPAVKIIRDTTSADSRTDLFEGILREAQNNLIMKTTSRGCLTNPAGKRRHTTFIKSPADVRDWPLFLSWYCR